MDRLKVALALLTAGAAALVTTPASGVRADDAAALRQTAEDALVYGFPMVMNYGVVYEYVHRQILPAVQVPVQPALQHGQRVFTPKDTAVVTPNSDTPYSFFCDDLRAEPVVLTVSRDREGAIFLRATGRLVHVQLRLRRQPHHRQRRRHAT